MTPERWQQIEELFDSALERHPHERAAYLDEACRGDESLRQELESLIANQEFAGKSIEAAIELAVRELAPGSDTPDVMQRIGPYKIIRRHGHGGMGSVYLAVRDDDQYKKRVAIKVIKRGMDTEDILRRFRNERQILASLDHANIARLYDGGMTEDGRPYFVMEYVEGTPLVDYSDAHRLSTSERLELFRAVCSAVHYAHQNLIVHRDLKPGNILVTEEGVAKLLDFGIAKLLNPELSAQTFAPTKTQMRLMTPDYASPEQVRGETITTASDIYSLGVLLYELLTGHRPYHIKSSTPQEIIRAVCEQEPEKPSTAISRTEEVAGPDGKARITLTPERVSQAHETQPDKLRRQLVGDLDNIVLMAMRKEARRRYGSVEQLSEDIRRHLLGLPVIARKDTFGYRTGKFIKRHKAGVAAAALLVVTLFAGLAGILWQASVARAQRAVAERRFNDVRELANSFLFEFHDAIETLPGSTPARELLVSRALRYLDRLSQEAGHDASLQSELATAYQKVGNVQGNPYFANLGDTAGALESYRKALALRQALFAANPSNAQIRYQLATSHYDMSEMLLETGDTAGALVSIRQAVAIFEELLAQDPANTDVANRVGGSYTKIGNLLAQTGDVAGALESHRKTVEIDEALLAADPMDAKRRRNLSVSLLNSGRLLAATGDMGGALESYRRALEIQQALSAGDPTNAKIRRELALVQNDFASALAATGDTTAALQSCRQSVVIQEALLATDPKNAQVLGDLTLSYDNVGDLLVKTGDMRGAMENYRKSLAIRDEESKKHPTYADARRYLAISHDNVGNLLARTGDTRGAIERYRAALTLRERLAAEDSTNVKHRRDLAKSLSKLGEACTILASNKQSGAGEQKESLRQARLWYQRSLEAWLYLRERTPLSASDAGEPDRIAGEIAKCDSALKASN
jgi:eukaryotic-like serine/threonine-protein kinase